MVSSEVLRRRLAALLAETEQLPPPEQIVHMDPAERAGALTQSWTLRRDWKRFKDDLDDKTLYDGLHGPQWTEVAVELSNVIESMRHYDWLQMEFLVHSQHSLKDRLHTLRAIPSPICDPAACFLRYLLPPRQALGSNASR